MDTPIETLALIFVFTLAIILAMRIVAHRIGLVDHPGQRKLHGQAVPLVGGIAIYIGFSVPLFLLGSPSPSLIAFTAASGILVLMGALDDRFELSPWARFAVQIAATLIMVKWGGLVIADLGGILGTDSLPLGDWAVPFTVLGTVGVINAINMMDGVDGLAGGISLIALLLLGAVALQHGAAESALMGFGIGIALTAFLLFNMRLPGRPRASVFLGDAGSTFLGFAITWLLVALSQQPVPAISPATALWILAIPLVDTVSIMFRRVLKGRSPFSADNEHLHHILIVKGYRVCQTTFIVMAISLILSGFALGAEYWGVSEQLIFSAFIGFFALYFLGMMHAWRLMKALPGPEKRLTAMHENY